jgi:hypothetical protein
VRASVSRVGSASALAMSRTSAASSAGSLALQIFCRIRRTDVVSDGSPTCLEWPRIMWTVFLRRQTCGSPSTGPDQV